MSPDPQNINILRTIGFIAAKLNPTTQASYRELVKEIEDLGQDLPLAERLVGRPLLEEIAKDDGKVAQVSQQLQEWSERGIQVVVLGEPHYPRRLTKIFEPPLVLYHKGELSAEILEKPTIAIVGSRDGDLTACQTARDFARDLARNGVCIVSGLALGIDSAAHLGSLESKCSASTIAVLGNGLNTVYPARNYSLANNILEQEGVLLSQYQVDQRPFPSNFLERNRIIAGLADGVLVVQAAKRSGSLVTARYALEENRDVLAVPGAIADSRCKGSNGLIKEGAYLVDEVADILAILPNTKAQHNLTAPEDQHKPTEQAFPEEQRAILKLLAKQGELHYSKFPGYGTSPAMFSKNALELELLGVIRRLPGNYLQLC